LVRDAVDPDWPSSVAIAAIAIAIVNIRNRPGLRM
jgi:hypothetical protein